jgi:hypothetical protein
MAVSPIGIKGLKATTPVWLGSVSMQQFPLFAQLPLGLAAPPLEAVIGYVGQFWPDGIPAEGVVVMVTFGIPALATSWKNAATLAIHVCWMLFKLLGFHNSEFGL